MSSVWNTSMLAYAEIIPGPAKCPLSEDPARVFLAPARLVRFWTICCGSRLVTGNGSCAINHRDENSNSSLCAIQKGSKLPFDFTRARHNPKNMSSEFMQLRCCILHPMGAYRMSQRPSSHAPAVSVQLWPVLSCFLRILPCLRSDLLFRGF